jgi:hypothetical protein
MRQEKVMKALRLSTFIFKPGNTFDRWEFPFAGWENINKILFEIF